MCGTKSHNFINFFGNEALISGELSLKNYSI